MEGNQRAAISWETFVLATSAPLGPFRQVHIAPKFPPGRLNMALRTELPLLENELLVALIDNDSGGFQSSIALTTSRLYWTVREQQEAGNRSGIRPPVAIRTYGMDYALISQGVRVEPSLKRGFEIVLGAGRSLTLSGVDSKLAEALACYLRTVGEAARSGAVPSHTGIDSGLIQRIERVLPTVAEVTRQIRALNRDLHTFRRDLMAATPRGWVTHLLTLVCVSVFAVMVLSGVHPLLPTTEQLRFWGANDGVRVALRHEWWRLPASVFIHGGLIHLAVNMWCLLSIGPLVERLFGNAAFAVLYLAAGVGGAIASMATQPPRVSVGASGAIFGMLGALLAFLLAHRHSVPSTVLKPLRSSALSFVIFNTLFGAVVPNIDQAAHMGGLVTGFLGGLILIRPWPVVRSTGLTLRRTAMGIALVAVLLGGGICAVRWRERTLPPQVRFEDFNRQIAPAIREFNDIALSLQHAQQIERKAENPETRTRASRTLQDLRARASETVNSLKHVVTPDPGLQQICQTLIDGLTAQISTLDASLGYLATRDSRLLTGPDGINAGMKAIARASREFAERRSAFLKSNGLDARELLEDQDQEP